MYLTYAKTDAQKASVFAAHLGDAFAVPEPELQNVVRCKPSQRAEPHEEIDAPIKNTKYKELKTIISNLKAKNTTGCDGIKQ